MRQGFSLFLILSLSGYGLKAFSENTKNVWELYLRKGGDRHSTNVESPFFQAIRAGEYSKVELFLERDFFDVNFQNSIGETALHLSLRMKQYSIMHALLLKKKGIDPNLQNEKGETPLHLAVQSKQYRTAKLLLKKGADPSIEDKNGESPVTLSMKTNSYDLIKLLSDPRYKKKTDLKQLCHKAFS